MKTIWNDLLNLFFPNLCIVCKENLIECEDQICLNCLYKLPNRTINEYQDNLASDLFIGKVRIEYATALLNYEKGNSVQTIVHSFKYQNNKELAYLMGRQLALAIQNSPNYTNTDLLIPVPLHKKRQKKRGYNQSEWICKGLSSILQVPINTTAISRISKSDTQTSRNIFERWKNMEDVFEVTDKQSLIGKRITIVDDVITSGSTICACAKTLQTIPDIKINVLVLAITV